MKRAVLPLALVLAILLCAEAPAATPKTLKGDLETGGRVAFELKRTAGGQRKVVRWRWKNLPITCAKGKSVKHDGVFQRYPLKVEKDRSFEGRAVRKPPQKGFAEVNGSFASDSWKRASGTFQVSGDTSQGTKCESGVVNWTAKRR